MNIKAFDDEARYRGGFVAGGRGDGDGDGDGNDVIIPPRRAAMAAARAAARAARMAEVPAAPGRRGRDCPGEPCPAAGGAGTAPEPDLLPRLPIFGWVGG